MVSVLFICLGNICRSPMAEAVFTAKAQASGWGRSIVVDSAGTGDWHVGCAPDERAQAVLKARGYDGSRLRARQITRDDLDRFDYLVAMDNSNYANVSAIAAPPPDNLHLFLKWEPSDVMEVPDPYYGNESDFNHVLDLVERAADGLLEHIRQSVQSPSASLTR